MPRILGITLHQKQGELKTMPNQPPSDSARQRPATPVFNPHGSGRSPHNTKKRNEPNPPRLTIKNAKRTQSQPRPQSNCAKRTQFTSTPVRPTTSLCKTNPISARPKYETNPIYTAADLWKTKKTKRTQFAPLAAISLYTARSYGQRKGGP